MNETNLELREGGRILTGRFPYGRTAVVADRGRARKEMISPKAFSYAIDDQERDIHLLSGHQFSFPLASRKSDTLTLKDADDALSFEATLPIVSDQPSWMRDTVMAVRAGLFTGVSPGFRIPPEDVVPGAVEMIPERGNPGVYIKRINAAVLFELSLVSRPAYDDTSVVNRSIELHESDKVTWRLPIY